MKASRIETIVEHARRRLSDLDNMKKAGLMPMSGDFYPAGVHYPPITDYPESDETELLGSYTLPEDRRFDIYVHIPFCRKQCVFCHYPSLYNAPVSEKDRYLDALEKEMDIVMRKLGLDVIKARSILIGGGTPTDLTPEQLYRFLHFFDDRVDLSDNRQFNFDVDPITLVGSDGIERLKIMRDFGADRLTIGVQSFNDTILKKMNRSHDRAAAMESITNCLEMGFQVNIELIFGYPGQTMQNWIEVMDDALNTDVHEIQFYRLKVEPYGDQVGAITKIGRSHRDLIPNDEEAILMKQISIDMMAEKGFFEQMRRVFTQDSKNISQYAYNQCCDLLDEIGFGLSAFSSLRDRFLLNVQSFDKYYQAIAESRIPINRGIVRSTEEQIRWATVLPLKNHFIKKDVFQDRTGQTIDDLFADKFNILEEYGLLEQGDDKIELTTLGAFFADEVVTQFYSDAYLPLSDKAYAQGPLNPWKNPTAINAFDSSAN